MDSRPDDQVCLILDDGNRLICSKKLLGKTSPYFEAMFSLGFSESVQSEVKLQGPLSSPAVAELLKHAEGFELQLSEENVLAILQVAGMLQFEKARITCINFLKSTLEPSNLVKIFAASDLLGESDLRKLSFRNIVWRFSSTVSDNLAELSFELLKEIVDHPNLRVSSEVDVYQAISDWIDHDPDNRMKHICDLLKSLRIDQMSENDLSDLLNYHLVLESVEARNFIESELKLKSEKSKAGSLSQNFRTKSRVPFYLPCVVGQVEEKHWILRFNYRTNKLEQLVELDKVSMNGTVYASGYQVVASGLFIYVVGGEFMLGRSNWNKAVWVYDTLTEEWSHALTLDTPRRHLSLCVSSDPTGSENSGKIFLVGGFGKHRIILDLMDRICLEDSDSLQECPVLPIQMYSPAVCMFRGRLFVIKNSINCFHPGQGFWSTISHFNFPKDVEFRFALATEDFIYLTASHRNQLFRFDPDKTGSGGEKLDFEIVGSFSRSPDNVCFIENESKIFSFSNGEKSCIETFNILAGKFEIVFEDDSENFHFSPNFSLGCFPLVTFP